VARVEEHTLWNAGENFVFAVYPVGRTALIRAKLRDKCKIEKTLFSNFSFFRKLRKYRYYWISVAENGNRIVEPLR
jgi:hypothetical protein